MIGLGTIINTAAVIAGGLLGICLKRGMKQKMQDTLMQACGVSGIFLDALSGRDARFYSIYRNQRSGIFCCGHSFRGRFATG